MGVYAISRYLMVHLVLEFKIPKQNTTQSLVSKVASLRQIELKLKKLKPEQRLV